MVFLRPTVIRNENQSIAVASDRYDYIRGAQLGIQPEQNVFYRVRIHLCCHPCSKDDP